MNTVTTLPVDPQNPGQVLACCGLLELTSRLYGPVLSQFQLAPPAFLVEIGEEQLRNVLRALQQCPVQAFAEDALILGEPFHLRLDWWLEKKTAKPVPKTWAGGQRPLPFFRAYQKALKPDELPVARWWDSRSSGVEAASFCFDPREFTHSLDTGFSTYDLKVKAETFVMVELLAFIGLQRFRPAAENRVSFSYLLWHL
ncbi:MAG: hypothetical protein ACK42L_00865, partial [Thermoanaerobaculum sp.]